MGAKNYSTAQRQAIVQFILAKCIDGKPPRGTFTAAQTKFNVSRATCSRFWSSVRKQQTEGVTIDIVNGKKNRTYNKHVQLDLQLLQRLHYTKRGTIRSLAIGLGCSRSTVGRWVKTGMIRAHTSAIRPDLTANNKLLRIKFSLEAIELDRFLKVLKFKDMHNIVHIDEKWFYITKGSHRFYLAPNEVEPHRTCKNKKFISKIMFMCAVCIPLFGMNGEVLFDRKIDIFPFTKIESAKRRSKNRDSGTMVTKPIESITKDVIKECIITKSTKYNI